MPDRWYYTHDRQSHGPLSAQQIKELALRGLLTPGDMVWREGCNRQTAVRADTVVDFKPTPAPVPGWLSDVEKVEATRVRKPQPPKPAAQPLLWLDDIRRLENLLAAGRSPIPVPPPSSIPMDWLEDIRHIEESLRPGTKAAGAPAPPAALPSTPAGRASPSPPAKPPSPPPSLPAPPVKPVPGPTRTSAPPPTKPGLLPAPVVQAVPGPARSSSPPKVAPGQAPTPPAKPVPQPGLVAPVPPSPPSLELRLPGTPPGTAPPPSSSETTGFDPDTGQILDGTKYARWQKEQQLRRQEELQAQPTVSVYEAFLIARTAFQEFVDAEVSKPFIMAGDLEAIRQLPPIQSLLRSYAGYGAVMEEKLGKHLGFLVENRRKFYVAFG